MNKHPPEDNPASDLRYISSLPPRLRTSEDSALRSELELELERVQSAPLNDKDAPPVHEPHTGHIDPPPDGGLTAWLTVIGSAFSILCVLGLVTGAGQLQAYYLKHQLSNYSTSTVAWIASTQITLTFGGAVISGALFDAYSARPLVVASTIGQVGSLVALACESAHRQS